MSILDWVLCIVFAGLVSILGSFCFSVDDSSHWLVRPNYLSEKTFLSSFSTTRLFVSVGLCLGGCRWFRIYCGRCWRAETIICDRRRRRRRRRADASSTSAGVVISARACVGDISTVQPPAIYFLSGLSLSLSLSLSLWLVFFVRRCCSGRIRFIIIRFFPFAVLPSSIPLSLFFSFFCVFLLGSSPKTGSGPFRLDFYSTLLFFSFLSTWKVFRILCLLLFFNLIQFDCRPKFDVFAYEWSTWKHGNSQSKTRSFPGRRRNPLKKVLVFGHERVTRPMDYLV